MQRSYKLLPNNINISLKTTPCVLILLTAVVLSDELCNGAASGKNFWFFLSMGLTIISYIGFFIWWRSKIQLAVIDYVILLFILVSFFYCRLIQWRINNKTCLTYTYCYPILLF